MGDQAFFAARKVGTADYTLTANPTSGLVEVTPPTDFVGTIEIDVTVGNLPGIPNDSQRVAIEFT